MSLPITSTSTPPIHSQFERALTYNEAGGVGTTTREMRLYIWQAFVGWCRQVGLEPAPAEEDTVLRYLAACHLSGQAPGTLRNTSIAIRWAHAEAGLPSPCGDRVARLLAGVRRTSAHTSTQAHPITPDEVAALLSRDHRTQALARTHAVLALSRSLGRPVRDVVHLTIVNVNISSAPATVTVELPDGCRHELTVDGDHRNLLAGGTQLAAFLRRDDVPAVRQPLLVGSRGETITSRAIIALVRQYLNERDGTTTGADDVWGHTRSDADAVTTLARLDIGRLRALRNDVLIVLCFFGALRLDEVRTATVADWQHERTAAGVGLFVPVSKTDPTGTGAVVALPWRTHGGRFEPAKIVDAWIIEASLTRNDPLIPAMQHGTVGSPPTPYTNTGPMRQQLRRMGVQASLEAHLTGHSGRRGWATAAASEGLELEQMMRHTRHRMLDTLRLYIDRDVAGDVAVPAAIQTAILNTASRQAVDTVSPVTNRYAPPRET